MECRTSKNMYVVACFVVAALSGNKISKNSRRSGGMDELLWAAALFFLSSIRRIMLLFFFWHNFLVSANSAARAFCSADRMRVPFFLSPLFPVVVEEDRRLAGSEACLHGWSAGKRCFRHVFLPQMLHTHGTSSSVLHPGQQHRNVTHVVGLGHPTSMCRETASSTLCPGLTSTTL